MRESIAEPRDVRLSAQPHPIMQSTSIRVAQHAIVTLYHLRKVCFASVMLCTTACADRKLGAIWWNAKKIDSAASTTQRASPSPSALAPNQANRVLRVCADPNNLPFSNNRGAGFENALAVIVARELGARLEYVWWAQRRGFVRSTLRTNSCDVIAGIPTSLELVTPTRPYYRSTYVFVTRRHSRFRVATFDDAVLRQAKIGVQLVGDDYANSPPVHALGARGIVQNVQGFSVYGDYSDTIPTAPIMRAIAAGEVDIAIVWGPLAGFYAKHSSVRLHLTPVSPQIDVPFLPFVYDISMGVRHGETDLRDSLNNILSRRRLEIDSLLTHFGVPRADQIVHRRSER